MVVVVVTVGACSPGDGDGNGASVTVAVSGTSQPATTDASTTTPRSTTAVPTTVRRTTTTSSTSSTTTTTTTTPPPRDGEPARSRPASPLARPTGFNRFEPGPVYEGIAALTGRPAGRDVTTRAALAVKIDNAPGGQPQWNLADADLVFEENVEGVTRFIAVFHTNVPDRIGPVRSARTSDRDILASLNRPILAWSGGNRFVTGEIRGGHEFGWLANLSAQSSDCFWRSGTRSSPHNLVLDPACAWQSATFAGPARPVLAHDTGGPPPAAGRRDSRFTVEMDGIDVTWVWDAASGRYLRRQRGDWHVDVDGDQVAADNVVVLTIDYVRSKADERSPEAVSVGSGRAVLHRNGVAITGTWTRASRFSVFTLTADDGSPLALTPGTAFVELAR